MSFSVDDYPKAIARIFRGSFKDNLPIGTGFLIAPGYVLTCAHVVLQAIGIKQEEFTAYEGQPSEQISLDFPILASGHEIKGEVIEWIPYSLEQGDVAVLKLLTPEPGAKPIPTAKPIPLDVVSWNEVRDEELSVYGFGNKIGGQSDAYRLKTQVAGGRFQLCKLGDVDDDTIQSGFSGAPVWNGVRERVIGMVATAEISKEAQRHKAYLIPTEQLQALLKKVDAFSLYDVLEQSLAACTSEDECHQLKIAIDRTLKHCHPNGGDRSWQGQLRLDELIGLIGLPDWEGKNRLVKFAVMLACMKDKPQSGYQLNAGKTFSMRFMPEVL
jgi:V8-like Glu-specific endopeptidase